MRQVSMGLPTPMPPGSPGGLDSAVTTWEVTHMEPSCWGGICRAAMLG